MPWKFTHAADFAARIVIQNALFLGRKKLSALVMPWCTYTDPEIAHVGMYERDAHERGIEVDTFVRELKDVDRVLTDGEEEGFVKVHVRKGTDRILGATIVARHAGEMISEITLAIVHGLGLGKIASVIHPYPTQAEAIRQVADAYNRTRLTPLVKSSSPAGSAGRGEEDSGATCSRASGVAGARHDQRVFLWGQNDQPIAAFQVSTRLARVTSPAIESADAAADAPGSCTRFLTQDSASVGRKRPPEVAFHSLCPGHATVLRVSTFGTPSRGIPSILLDDRIDVSHFGTPELPDAIPMSPTEGA